MLKKGAKLEVHEEVILALYEMLYGKQYDCIPTHSENGVNLNHVNAQKASYIFSEMMVPTGDYGFCWNHIGPYSEQLQNHLRALDRKPELVKEYYNQFDQNYEEKLNELFTRGQIQKIKRTAAAMKEIVNNETGGELLGSLLYISRTVLPGREFDKVNSELQKRKSYFSNNSVNEEAWKALGELDLVPTAG